MWRVCTSRRASCVPSLSTRLCASRPYCSFVSPHENRKMTIIMNEIRMNKRLLHSSSSLASQLKKNYRRQEQEEGGGDQNNRYHFSTFTSSSLLALSLLAIASFTSSSSTVSFSDAIEDEDNFFSSKAANKPLTRSFIADAAAVVAPTVVNIVAKSHGFIPLAHAGSGFIISEDGYIATNAHVVKSAKVGGVVEVTLSSGVKYPARVWGMDEASDIALLKLELEKVPSHVTLPVAQIGESSALRAGEFVVAVGSPMQLMNSVTYGIVSAPARNSSELHMGANSNFLDYIQTDASINVGNSGGPLVNLDGAVIGINTMKAKDLDGVSFAIPMDAAWAIIQQLKRKPGASVHRPYVGLRMVNFKPSKKSSKSSSELEVLITDVTPGSPADRAGLRLHDVILEINDREMHRTKDVLSSIGWEVGRELRIKIRRSEALTPDDTQEVVLVTGEKTN